ncbi:hypothetical protein AQUCO_00800223v1 [Aquilegia coerulea]|uniref:Uncharacterized protein n=1 Tax=Aquilegia coerulea TaxID=218851 RepID=A0A2G5EI11_AQUCA|nr:hypothetical protein AQUCO_00800223v1 [Aquilegia coerulea]
MVSSSASCLILLLVNLQFSNTHGEIRRYEINSNLFNLNTLDNETLFIDSFHFTNKGRIEVNVSDIYLSISYLNLNFSSKLGFIVAPTYNHRNGSKFEKIKAGYSFDKLNKGSKSFDIVFGEKEDNMFVDSDWGYALYFVNNLSFAASAELEFSMIVLSSMYNLELDSNIGQWTKRNYLSENMVLFPKLHFGFILIYMCLILISLRNIHVYLIKLKTQNHRLRIQIAILVVLIIKVLSLLSLLVRNTFIRQFGYSQGFFLSTLAYGSVLFSEVPFATLMILISCGWSYLKPSFSLKEKIILVVVIIFHSAMSVDVAKYSQVRPNCERCHICLETWWIFRLGFDLIVFVYCTHSSYYFLREGKEVEGKALSTLVKVKFLRALFYLGMFFHFVKYSYTIYEYEPSTNWTVVLLGETLTFSIYVFMEYTFWPDLPSLKLRIDDDLEYVAAEILDRAQEVLF